MSKQSLQDALTRAIDDNDFRSQLANNPDSALSSYDLTADERTALMSAEAGQLEQHLGPLDERTSKSILPLGPGWTIGGDSSSGGSIDGPGWTIGGN